MTKDPLSDQIGGDHYKRMGMEPFEFSLKARHDPFVFSVVKYVSRHSLKGGRQDLEKALHVCKLRQNLVGYPQPVEMTFGFGRYSALPLSVKPEEIPHRDLVFRFCYANRAFLSENDATVILLAHEWNYLPGDDPIGDKVICAVKQAIDTRYPMDRAND